MDESISNFDRLLSIDRACVINSKLLKLLGTMGVGWTLAGKLASLDPTVCTPGRDWELGKRGP